MQIRFGAILISVLAMPLAAQAQTFPGADWQRKTPAEAGINPQLLKDAIDFAVASEIKNPRDLKLNHFRTFGREPFDDASPYATAATGDDRDLSLQQRAHARLNVRDGVSSTRPRAPLARRA